MRSGMVTGLILAIAAVTFILAYQEHTRGNFHKLKEKIATEQPEAATPLPGGQEALALTRTRMMEDTMPEFLSVTMLPGRGMNVLQIVAYVPGKGEVNLLASPSVADAATAMTGKGKDANGQMSLAMGGAFEAPWAGNLRGTASPVAGRITTVWHGHTMQLPAWGMGDDAAASGGLMLAAAADQSGTVALPDGGQAQADFHGFGEHWPSTLQVTVTALLSSRTIDLTVVAHNTGDVAEPVGIGWQPRFAVMDGERNQMRLRIPAESRVETLDRPKGAPSGELVPVAGTAYDFSASEGVKLGSGGLDECFTDLQQDLLENGPAAELSDLADGYKLRLTALSSNIRAMRVVAPANGEYLSIDPQFNYPDPFGREWDKNIDTGMVVLEPGQTTQWKVRLEILPTAGGEPAL
jgi:aldose 1-epimerase